MLNIPGLEKIELLYDYDHFLLYRATHKATGRIYCCKLLKKQLFPLGAEKQLKHELEISTAIRSTYTLEPCELITDCDPPALLLEDVDGTSLINNTNLTGYTQKKLTGVALQITQALDDIHSAGVVLGNLDPNCIFYNPMTGQLKIVDLGAAFMQPLSRHKTRLPRLSGSVLPYISPEQTGRLTHGIDHRSDFYSLGICLYQLFTGTLPIKASDPAEYFHLHIAKDPSPPHLVNRAIPRMISRIIMRLMEKTPDSRYQSCRGILHDLKSCLSSLVKYGNIAEFPLGEHDISDVFSISAKLYGRDREVAAILKAFEEVQKGPSRMLLVAGKSGIGKSSLADSLRQPVVSKHGFFLSGKFDQTPSDIPYMPVIKAFQGLISQILAGGDTIVQQWRKRILRAVGNRGRIIADVIPEIGFIIGPQPVVPRLSPQENENRFSTTLSDFIHCCSSRQTPLVLFLDDMQWADTATLKLIEHLLTHQKNTGTLILGAYRSDEVEDSHPLHLCISRIQQSGGILPFIELPPLSPEDVTNLLADSLTEVKEDLAVLARICREKTNGNPFFLRQFLHGAHLAGAIYFDRENGRWRWHEQAVAGMSITDNLLQLQAKRLHELTAGTLKILKYAACLGNNFDPVTLAAVCREPYEYVLECLDNLGEIIIESEVLPVHLRDQLASGNHQISYKFAHDQLHRLACELLSGDEKIQVHYSIGRELKKLYQHLGGFSEIFDIAGHLNIGAAVIESPGELRELAQLNLKAGRKALASAASLSAYNYLQSGLKLLPADCWEHDYQLSHALHVETAEAAYQSGTYDHAEKLFHDIVEHSNTLLDQAKAYSIHIRSLKAQNMAMEAILSGLEILEKFGVRLPARPGKLRVLAAFLATKIRLARYSSADILHLPVLDDAHIEAVMNFLFDMGTAAYYASPTLVPIIGATTIRLSLKHGNCSYSAIMGYATHGFLECGLPFGSIDRGYELGRLSLDLHNRDDGKHTSPQTQYLVTNLLRHWKEHINDTIPAMLQAHAASLERGDFEVAANALYSCGYRYFFSGLPLPATYEKMTLFLDIIERLGHRIPLYRHLLFLQAVENLRSPGIDRKSFSGRHYQEKIMVPQHQRSQDRTSLFLFFFLKLHHAVVLQQKDQAPSHMDAAQQYLSSVTASLFVPLFTFLSALTLIDIYPDASSAQRLKMRLRLFKYMGNLRRWATHSPHNFRHKYLLIKAEMACLHNNPGQAASSFNAALQIAADNGYIQDIALIHERYGQYYLRQNWEHLATPHLRKAWELYHRWGALAKTVEMERRYAMVDFSRTPEASSAGDQHPLAEPDAGHAAVSPYDAAAIIKATRTLTEMIFEEDFLKKLMEIMIEIAGAQKGVLLFPKGSSWEGRLQGHLTDNGIQVKPLVQRRRHKIYSANIVRYVARTMENVVLNNASGEGLFTRDGYVVRYRPQSILCTPVIHHGRISCIVYLENNIASGAFPPERQEIIHLLGSHAAISLKNSNLYNELEAMVERLHQEIGKHKATQLQLLQAEKQAALGRLSASIAHEFGNPLTGIQYLFKDIVDRFELSEDDRKLIEIGLEESRRMKSLIQDMQQLNMPSSGKKTIFNPHKTLENILLFQKNNLSSNNISVVRKYGKNVGKIHAVEDQITQVLVNITLNAVDAMKENGGTLTILTGEDDGSLNIVIMDTGKGIAEVDQENIFEPFFSTKPCVEGTGLGLPVSYSIIKEHGGDISFVSSPGKGTQFHIRLPLKQQVMTPHLVTPN